MGNFKNMLLIMAVTALLATPAYGTDRKPVSPIKKTLDGRCLTISHTDYWKTKIYVAKPSLEACIASGGRKI